MFLFKSKQILYFSKRGVFFFPKYNWKSKSLYRNIRKGTVVSRDPEEVACSHSLFLSPRTPWSDEYLRAKTVRFLANSSRMNSHRMWPPPKIGRQTLLPHFLLFIIHNHPPMERHIRSLSNKLRKKRNGRKHIILKTPGTERDRQENLKLTDSETNSSWWRARRAAMCLLIVCAMLEAQHAVICDNN